MNWAIKIISKTLMTKISHISWWGYDKGFYGKSRNANTEMNKNHKFTSKPEHSFANKLAEETKSNANLNISAMTQSKRIKDWS